MDLKSPFLSHSFEWLRSFLRCSTYRSGWGFLDPVVGGDSKLSELQKSHLSTIPYDIASALAHSLVDYVVDSRRCLC
uniref:Uncharacterized protein n=1 Tax=Utricularia reniformis TaxID=192314 RepID=A0A1Y0B1V8_9LAMI|nr:hypothetical protein AEK19_MT1218 [Utricularia reniformis]ART31432.1 hypothetical protein AEK19_MT1218 [Utricularia reniformis]